MEYKKEQFTLDLFDFKESVTGITFNRHWNGWECPYFSKDNALRLVGLFNRHMGMDDNPLKYDSKKDLFIYDNGQSDDYAEYEEYEPTRIDGKNYYQIGAYNWCWMIKRGWQNA